jgi:hypothetical protein
LFGLGGNNGQIINTPNSLYQTFSIGTVDDAPFIMKANNRESMFITPGGKVGIGWNNTNGGAPIDFWSDANPANNQSRLSIYADKQGNIESSENMTLIFKNGPAKQFQIKEGSFLGGTVSRFTVLSGGFFGINNPVPTAALDIRSNLNGANFRIFADATGIVESTVDMKSHYSGAANAEFQINRGAPGSANTGFLMNVWGAHFNTSGTFNGLFVGPSASTWYNNTGNTRLWLDAIGYDGLAIVSGNGNNAMFVANTAGATRYEMKINSGGGDDTKFKLCGSAQFGFYQSTATFEDVNTRINIDASNLNGVKISSNTNNTKAFFIENTNFPSGPGLSGYPFIVFADGRTQIGNAFPAVAGVASQAKLSVDGLILARDIRVSNTQGTHWADYVFEKNYKLMPLNEVEKFVQANKHLPEVPSESDVKKDGVDLLEMNVVLLKKIEELYLYTFELTKSSQQQKALIEELSKQIANGNIK